MNKKERIIMTSFIRRHATGCRLVSGLAVSLGLLTVIGAAGGLETGGSIVTTIGLSIVGLLLMVAGDRLMDATEDATRHTTPDEPFVKHVN